VTRQTNDFHLRHPAHVRRKRSVYLCKNDVTAFRCERFDRERSSGSRIEDSRNIFEDGFYICSKRLRKRHHRLPAIELLKLLHEPELFDCNGNTTGDESWLQYHYHPQEMFVPSREQVAPDVRTKRGVQNAMITVFFTSTMLGVNEPLP
jgi:hypothetical protein